ncbi:CBR-KAL-1 protein [Aphelenchoides fujianensis]|nr:CBR-KAL-1 protein [Aphelenchoides fujianensis]
MLPCKEQFGDDQRCAISVCMNAANAHSCEDSCVFAEKIARRKPGQCPAPPADLVASECSATCNRDADCREAERCCTRGCSRTCLPPVFADDQRLLPVPDGITVQERKRKRSAVIRWILKRMSPQHTATNSNLYVIQWRWGVQKDAETMTPWQTIVVKNKMYAILKHLLSPGRYYIFRVAAVNVHGTAGFSRPSPPFKLTKEVRAPAQPLNLTVESENFDAEAKSWTLRVGWTPPPSELPLRDYVLSYWRSSLDGVELYEKQIGQKAALVQASDDSEDDAEEADDSAPAATSGGANGGGGPERRSTILPAHSTHAVLGEGLEANSVYVVELYANVDSTEGELRGESAILVVRTRPSPADAPSAESPTLPPWPAGSFYDTPAEIGGQPTNQKAEQTAAQPPHRLPTAAAELPNESRLEVTTGGRSAAASDDSELFQADLQLPYLDAAHVLRSTLSWLDHPKCTSERRDFDVRLEAVRCPRPLLAEQLVGQCVAPLEKLHFGCDYKVEVRDTEDRQLITRLAFSTPPCSRTPSADPIDCRQLEERPQVRCLPLATGDGGNSVECEWSGLDAFGFAKAAAEATRSEAPLVGYRVVLTSSRDPRANITIVAAAVRSLRYDRLTDGADYRLQVQALTAEGLSRDVQTEFRTGAAGSYVEVVQAGASGRTGSLFGDATFTSGSVGLRSTTSLLSASFFFLFLFLRW